eukprot:scaffold38258_cov67-Phaeocystis_antarctica.AAC.6
MARTCSVRAACVPCANSTHAVPNVRRVAPTAGERSASRALAGSTAAAPARVRRRPRLAHPPSKPPRTCGCAAPPAGQPGWALSVSTQAGQPPARPPAYAYKFRGRPAGRAAPLR